jgi:enoyl-CoA hydratase/carnithine racemase
MDSPIVSDAGMVDTFRGAGGATWLVLTKAPDNKLDEPLARRLYGLLRDADSDPATRAVVITGSGDQFCGGADVAAVKASGRQEEFAAAVASVFAQLRQMRKPVLAAVNGDALAGGFGLVCCCDIVIATPRSALGTVEAQFAAWPMLAQVAMNRRVPEKAAIRNALTGEPFAAAEALELGVIDAIAPATELQSCVEGWVDRVTISGAAGTVGRPLFYRTSELDFAAALDQGRQALAASLSDPPAGLQDG